MVARGRFRAGHRVRVVTGPFADFEGIVLSVDAAGRQLTVSVDMFGRETPVTLDLLEVENCNAL